VDGAERRRQRIGLLRERGGIARADEPERIASRIDRLSRYHSDVRPVSPSGIAAQDPEAMAAATAVLERVINTEDFLGVRYLEAGAAAAQAVGRVNIRERSGRLVGYGTGSLVSPELLLTNHHVLPDAGVAASERIAPPVVLRAEQPPTPVPSTGGQAQPPRVTVPLEITLSAGDLASRAPRRPLTEAISIDPDYVSRPACDPAFLGTGTQLVSLPTLPEADHEWRGPPWVGGG